jgi:hypothetical protein
MATEEVYLEFQRRLHRLLGAYLALWAWKNNVDCVVLSREELKSYLGLQGRIENEHSDRLTKAVKEIFSYSEVLYTGTGRYETLILSRCRIPDTLKGEKFDDDHQCAEWLSKQGINTGIVNIPLESDIIKMMSALSHGISDFSEFQADKISETIYTKR